MCTQEQCTWRHVSTSGGTCRLHSSQNSRRFPVQSFHASSLVLCLKHETKYLETSNASRRYHVLTNCHQECQKLRYPNQFSTPPPSIDDRSQILERSTSLRFLGIILRVLRLEVSVWISQTIGKGSMVFYHVFLLSFLQCRATEL
jgi:hypothetical protein